MLHTTEQTFAPATHTNLLFLQPVHDLLHLGIALDPGTDARETLLLLPLLSQLREHLLEQLAVFGHLLLVLLGVLHLQGRGGLLWWREEEEGTRQNCEG